MAADVQDLFATRVLHRSLGADAGWIDEALACALSLAEDDAAGQAWCEANGYLGYTSYASLDDLPWRFPPFAAVEALLAPHVAALAARLFWDLQGGALRLDSLWVNVLPPGAGHSGHIHPNAVVSGTIWLATPPGASPLRFEDPRLAAMMAAPPVRSDAPDAGRRFVTLAPRPGDVALWESWLRHEVPPTGGDDLRVSVSFNLRWDR